MSDIKLPIKQSNRSSNNNDSNSKQQDDVLQYQKECLLRLSSGSMDMVRHPDRGSYVIASRNNIQKGQILLECPAACIALDPQYRQSYCGYCASSVALEVLTQQQNKTNTNSSTEQDLPQICQRCHLITICNSCRDYGVLDWHDESGECDILQKLVESFMEVFTELQIVPIEMAAQQIESIYIISMRLLHRRHYDHSSQHQHHQQQQQREKLYLACPLPKIDWKLFDTLYGSLLTTSSSFVTTMATLIQVMNTKLQTRKQQKAGKASHIMDNMTSMNPHSCISVFSKCRGCCHGIVDLSKPLGSQNLGMALFISHSFYNHNCAPNAFLSCLLPSSKGCFKRNCNNIKNTPCTVVARVVSCSEKGLLEGETITLSYIPLSGLCRGERQLRLREAYHFECDCELCELTNSDACALEKAVCGEFAAKMSQDNELISALAPLRELQIDCYQKLMTASIMKTKSSSTCSVNNNRMMNSNNDGADDDAEKEDNLRQDLIEQSIATLQMAQRGIRNQNIPASHEVALECHRLLAIAYSLLWHTDIKGKPTESMYDEELHHHEQFFVSAEPARKILDSSALAIQHQLAAKCLRLRLEATSSKGDDDNQRDSLQAQYWQHVNTARATICATIGENHPFIPTFLQEMALNPEVELSVRDTDISSTIRKRKWVLRK